MKTRLQKVPITELIVRISIYIVYESRILRIYESVK